jgi:hypothetical protein
VPRSLCAFPKLSHEDSGGGPDPSMFPLINAPSPAVTARAERNLGFS